MPYIEKVLVASTGNVSRATAYMLDHADSGPVFQKGHYGWFVYVDDVDPDGTPADLAAAFALARTSGCQWVMFDRDADFVDELPRFEW